MKCEETEVACQQKRVHVNYETNDLLSTMLDVRGADRALRTQTGKNNW